MNTKFTVLFAFLLLGLASACGLGSGGSTETRNDTFVVGDAPRVIVTDDNGRVIVISSPGRMVSVKATLRKPNKIEYEVTQAGDAINVTAKTAGGGIFNFGQSPAADIEITTPANTSVELQTDNGSVEVRGIQQSGTLRSSTVRTSNGKVVLEKVS